MISIILGVGVSFATPTLEQLSTLSEQIISQANKPTTSLGFLKTLFTSCAEKNKNAETRQSCQEFLDTRFPALEKKYYQPTSWVWSTPYFHTLTKRISFKTVPNATGMLQIDWGDGMIETFPLGSDKTIFHTYSSSGEYEVKLSNTASLIILYPGGGHSSFVSSFILNDVSNLQQLYLGEGNIKNLKNGDFDGLPNLEILYLGRNEISSIEPYAFSGLTSLKNLNLRTNQLTGLNQEWLKGLENLTYLSFAENKLTTIDPNRFAHFKNLQYLDIGGNPFGKLKLSYFNGLEQLTEEGDSPSFRS